MSRFVRPCGLMASVATLLVGLSTQALAGLTTVYSNNSDPGDAFTNPSSSASSQAVGSSGWRYTEVKGGASVGINVAYPQDGDGSVRFATNGIGGKADISFGSVSITEVIFGGKSLGALTDLTALVYDWYRESSSTATQAPSIRLFVSNYAGNPFTAKSGFLVWEPVYNNTPVTTGAWVESNALTGRLWATGSLPGAATSQNLNLRTFDQLKTALAGYKVYGVNSGVGSGWSGNFKGAVDNITFGFNGASTTYNFEVGVQAVPEPSTVALGLIAGGGTLIAAARRRFLRV